MLCYQSHGFLYSVESNWAETMAIPTRFSGETTSSIDSGVLSKRSRDEIVQSLSTHILVHTNRPLPDDFHTVCRRLVEKYPSLKDTVDNGYVRTKVLIYVADM